MKKIFQSIRTLNLAGTEMVVMNWYRQIDTSKIQFDFGVNGIYNSPLVAEINQKGGKVLIIPNSNGIIGILKYLIALYITLKKNAPYEAFHSHEQWLGGLTCLVAKLVGIKKRFIISHYADTKYNISLKKRLFRPAARFLINHFATLKLAVSQEAGESLYGKSDSFVLIHNGIALTKFAYNPVIRIQKRKELNLENKFVVGHIGRFMKEKNHTFLIDIFAEIYKKNSKAHLVLLGVGKLEGKIRQKVEKLGLSQAVSFIGSRIDVQDFYQAFDVFVFPSLFEGLGIVAIEAQCSGLPCVMSDVIPKEAFVCNASSLSLSQSPQIWADKVIEITKNFIRKDESKVIRRAGFDISEVGKFIEKVYSK